MRNYTLPIYRQIALLLLACMPLPCQTAGQTAPPQSTAKTNVDEVMLDLVVRDKRGKPISDLTPEEIAITDNGVKQTVLGFRLVRGSEAVSATGAATPLDPLRQIRLVTLAFEPLAAPDQRKLARTAALDLVKGDQGVNVFYSVVVIDTQLLVLQHFTKDRAALAKAIERATEGVSAPRLAADSNAITAELRTMVNGLSTSGAVRDVNELSAVTQLADSGSDGQRPSIETLQARVMLDMLRMGAAVQSNGARLSLSALRALVDGLREMPGRKSIMYFSVGMYLGTELDTPFRNLVAAANRNNVTFYSVDVRGVMVSAQNTVAMTQLNGAAQASNDTTSSSNAAVVNASVTKAQMTAADTYESAGRANLDLPIRDLAESTGGFLIGDSNDLRVPLHHVNEEINSYYEVSYNPSIENYDASFRKVGVTTSRKDAMIHTRTGYFALPPAAAAAGLAPYEMPLLKAISDGKVSDDVHYRASAIVLQPKKDAAIVAVLLEVPLGGLQATAGTDTTDVHCTLAALIKDSKGALVQRISNDRSLRVTAAQRDTGNLLDKTILTLAPGKYTLDSAVSDMANMKIGAQHAEFEVASGGTGVGISALIPVRWFTPDARNLDPEDPFQVGGGSVTPTMDTDFKMIPNSEFRLFLTVYPDASIAAKPMVEIDIIKDGRSVGTAPVELLAADSRGRIPFLMTIPPGAIRAGTYEIHATVTQGSTSAVASTTIRFEQ
jgi:VWFA-related protein